MTGAPDYYKSILLYGLYNGAPVPLACDEQGRLILVTEQFSPWSRTGIIVLDDDFSTGLIECSTGTDGTGASVALDYTQSHVGGISVKLTGGKTGARYAYVQHYVHPSSYKKLGYEFSFRFSGAYDTLDFYWTIYTGTLSLSARLRHDFSEEKWQIYDYTSHAWIDVLIDAVYANIAADFNRFKLVIDIESMTYHAFRHATGVVDLSAYGLSDGAFVTPPGEFVQMQLVSRSGQNDWGVVDQVILTQDES